MKTFAEFWPYYVMEHGRRGTRALHAVGTFVSVALAVAFVVAGKWWLLPLAFVPGYAAAWVSHFFIEHNRPATFRHPLWSFAADYKMIALMLTGRMGRELEKARLVRSRASGD